MGFPCYLYTTVIWCFKKITEAWASPPRHHDELGLRWNWAARLEVHSGGFFQTSVCSGSSRKCVRNTDALFLIFRILIHSSPGGWGGGVCVCVCQDLICIPEDSDARGPQIIFSEIWALCSLQIQEHFLPSWIMCSSTQHFWFISPLLDNGQPLRVLEGKSYEARIRHTNTNNNLAASRGQGWRGRGKSVAGKIG